MPLAVTTTCTILREGGMKRDWFAVYTKLCDKVGAANWQEVWEGVEMLVDEQISPIVEQMYHNVLFTGVERVVWDIVWTAMREPFERKLNDFSA